MQRGVCSCFLLPPLLPQWIHERAYQNAEGNQRGCFDKHPRCNEWSQRTPSECKVPFPSPPTSASCRVAKTVSYASE